MERRRGWGEGWAIRDDREHGKVQVVRIEHPRLVVELAKTAEESWDIHSIELLDDVSVDFAGSFVEESFEVFFRWLMDREGREPAD